jgi:hypothetical protein
MILSTKKIKFSALNQVDDLDEGKCSDYNYIGQYCFVSCWTDLEEESLPFWNMYTPGMKGVRIKMPSTLFNNYTVSTAGITAIAAGKYKSIVPQNDSVTSHYWVFPTQELDYYLKSVNYTEDTKKLAPNIKLVSEAGLKFTLGEIGKYKAKHWSFQSEWRYILRIFPSLKKSTVLGDGNKGIVDAFTKVFEPVEKGELLPFSNFFVNINDSKFKQMEILLGPKHTESEKLIVESLIARFNPNAKLSISSLHKKVR